MTIAQIDELLAMLDLDIGIVLGWPSNLVPWRRDHYFGQFWKLGFCSISECEIFVHRGQLCKFIDHENVAIILT